MLSGSSSDSSSSSDNRIKQMPKGQSEHSNNLKITITPQTESAPRGKIITDDYRGTSFWEVAESSDQDNQVEDEPGGTDWSLPFQVEWITR